MSRTATRPPFTQLGWIIKHHGGMLFLSDHSTWTDDLACARVFFKYADAEDALWDLELCRILCVSVRTTYEVTL